MPLWIMPVYVISGIALLVSGYVSYANQPLCSKNIAIRNEAIRLHRIKLRQFELGIDEQFTPDEEAQYAIFKRADKKDRILDQVLSVSVPVHLFTLFILMISSNWGLQMPLYITSGFLILIGKIDSVVISGGFTIRPLCVTNQSFYELDVVESYYKQINGLPLNYDEQRYIKNYETEIRWNGWQMNVLYLGISLHLIATLLHAILNMFTS